jgi:hypothetical protein
VAGLIPKAAPKKIEKGKRAITDRRLPFFVRQFPMIVSECASLNPAWVEQVADATRQAVKSQ